MSRSDYIKEYLQGNQRGIEAHLLEKEALADPFLFEALEGLTEIPGDPLDGITRMEHHLAVTPPPAGNKTRWYWVAAGIVAVAGALTWVATNQDVWPGDTLLAGNQGVGTESRHQETVTTRPEERQAPGETGVDDSPDEAKSPTTVHFTPSVIKVADEVEDDAGTDVADLDDHRLIITQDESSKPDIPPTREEKREIEAAVLLADGKANRAEVPDTRDDSLTDAPLAAAITSRVEVLALDEAAPLDEVVTVGYARLKDTTEALARQETPADAIERDVAQFNQHAKESLQYPPSAVKNAEEGKIYLSFEVSPEGALANVRVISDFSSKECTKEFLRLLQTSPRWRHSPTGQKLYYVARFEIGQEGKPHRVELSYISSESD
ncbi:MAG: energy transducer TonB [Odoribacteraceae bacterium]|jgi:outer membrane biosynthesis protein TonB|nr:energy transducer TonB [Odoribacteraceae bacterium]